MRGIKALLIIFLCGVLLSFAAKIHTRVSKQAPEQEAPGTSVFAFWNGRQTVISDCTTEDDAKWMQRALNRFIAVQDPNAELLVVDGHFGPASAAATTAFQEMAGISADGHFGATTIRTMKLFLEDDSANSSDRIQIHYGSSSLELTEQCSCTPGQTCSDCSVVALFNAINSLKETFRKSPVVDALRHAAASALERLGEATQI